MSQVIVVQNETGIILDVESYNGYDLAYTGPNIQAAADRIAKRLGVVAPSIAPWRGEVIVAGLAWCHMAGSRDKLRAGMTEIGIGRWGYPRLAD